MHAHQTLGEGQSTFDWSSMQRDVLPMPDRPHEGVITYDAKDPDTSFPPIEPLRPPAGGRSGSIGAKEVSGSFAS